MGDDERRRHRAANAVSRELCDHVNVVDIDIGVIRDADSLLDGAIEGIHCRVNCIDVKSKGLSGLKQVRIASDHHSRPRRRFRHFGIQVCEIAAELRQ